MWHVSSRSGVATLRTAMHLVLTYLLITAAKQKSYQTAHCNIKSAVLTLLISSSVAVTQECNGLNRMILSNTRLLQNCDRQENRKSSNQSDCFNLFRVIYVAQSGLAYLFWLRLPPNLNIFLEKRRTPNCCVKATVVVRT